MALVLGGIVGLAMLVRGSNILAAGVGILLAMVLSFILLIDYSQEAAHIYRSSDPE